MMVMARESVGWDIYNPYILSAEGRLLRTMRTALSIPGTRMSQ